MPACKGEESKGLNFRTSPGDAMPRYPFDESVPRSLLYQEIEANLQSGPISNVISSDFSGKTSVANCPFGKRTRFCVHQGGPDQHDLSFAPVLQDRKRRTFRSAPSSYEVGSKCCIGIDAAERAPSEEMCLRFQASNVAQLSGLAPAHFGSRKNMLDIFIELVYQGSHGRRLLERDKAALHVGAPLSQRQRAEKAINELDSPVKRAVRKATSTGSRTNCVGELQSAKRNIVATINKEVAKSAGKNTIQNTSKSSNSGNENKLTATRGRMIMNHALANMNMSLGKRKENNGVRMYEKLTGRFVKKRNENLFSWPWPSPPSMKKSIMSYYRDEAEWRCFCKLLPVPNAIEVGRGRSAILPRARAYFTITAMIDGIACQDDGSPLLVEVKNRTRFSMLQREPPYYDVLQTVVYLGMLGIMQGDIVQYFNGSAKTARRPSIEPQATTFRVNLDAKEETHKWRLFSLIMPRLYALAQSVYAIRDDQIARCRLLLAHRDVTNKTVLSNDVDETFAWLGSMVPFLVKYDPQTSSALAERNRLEKR